MRIIASAIFQTRHNVR